MMNLNDEPQSCWRDEGRQLTTVQRSAKGDINFESQPSSGILGLTARSKEGRAELSFSFLDKYFIVQDNLIVFLHHGFAIRKIEERWEYPRQGRFSVWRVNSRKSL
jgi:hypothetical protein